MLARRTSWLPTHFFGRGRAHRLTPLFNGEASDSELGSPKPGRTAADAVSAARIRHQLAAARTTGRASWLRTSVIPLLAVLPVFAFGTILLYASLNETEDSGRSGWLITSGFIMFVLGSQIGLLAVPPASFKLGLFLACGSMLGTFAVALIFADTTARSADGAWRQPACMATYVLFVPFADNLGFTLIDGMLSLAFVDAVARALVGLYQDRFDSQRTCCGLEPYSARRLVEQIWELSGRSWTRACLLLAYGICVTWGHVPAADLVSSLVRLAALAWGAVFALSCSVRARVHAWLTWRGEEVSTAAGIAALLGEIEPAAAVVTGMARLRAIRADKLTRRVLDPASAAAAGANKREWYDKSKPALVDSIDAFVSHSWYDSPDDKWAALQSWRRAFVRANGREPLLWFDRCCIDQDDVVADLPLLPFYVASSRQFLIIAGPTYFERLWCVTELFVFAEMRLGARQQGEPTALDPVLMLTIPGVTLAHIQHFQVADARCALRSDYDRLLDCVEAACGSLPAFDERARSLLARAGGWHVGDPAGNPRPELVDGERRSTIRDAQPNRSQPFRSPSSATLATPAAARTWHRASSLLWRATFSYAHVVLAFVVVLTWASAPARRDCRACASMLAALPAARAPGWVEYGGAQYALRAERLSLPDARRACAADGGALLSLRGADEEAFARCLTSEQLGPSLEGPWLGAPAEGAGAYAAWASREPFAKAGGGAGGELCAYLWPDGWRTRLCLTKASSLCKRSVGATASEALETPLAVPAGAEAVAPPSASPVDAGVPGPS